MKIETKYFDRMETRKLKQKKGIVVHWPAGQVCNIYSLWNWMNDVSKNSYHGFISRDLVIRTRDPELRAIHAGHKTYTDFAKSFFGNSVCSDYDSPNNYTHAWCMLQDRPDGSYFNETIDTAVEFFAGECFKYNYDPLTQVICHSHITDEKSVFCPKFFEDNKLFEAFRKKINMYMNSFFVNARDQK